MQILHLKEIPLTHDGIIISRFCMKIVELLYARRSQNSRKNIKDGGLGLSDLRKHISALKIIWNIKLRDTKQIILSL